jgi:phage/plasmid primase-like uncharacterized protein
MITALETAIDRADLREIIADLYPDAGARPGLTKQRIKAVWRGGDGENVSLTVKTAHDFVRGETFGIYSFLTLIAGYGKAEAAAYLLRRAGLDDTPQGQRKAARRVVADKRRDGHAETVKARVQAAALAVQQTAPTEGVSGYLERKGIGDLFTTHRVAPAKLPSGETVAGLVYSADDDGPFIQLVLRDLEGTVTGFQRIYDDDRAKRFVYGSKPTGAFVLLEPVDQQLPKTARALNDLELAVCEGFATGATVVMARPRTTMLCALSAGNLAPVTAALRKVYGYTRRTKAKARKAVDLCIWGDLDASGTGQQAAHRAALESGCYVRLPKFRGGHGDFNDLPAARGLEAVRRTRKVTPDAALAFAKELSEQKLSAEKHLAPFALPSSGGALIVRSPQETGKTHRLSEALEHALDANLKVLVVTHRESLADSLAARLKLENYGDYPAHELRYVNRGLVICFDSLHKLSIGGELPHFDLLVIDECEQVFRHATAEHIKNKAASFGALTHYLDKAHRFIGLDANAGTLTRYALATYAPSKTVRWHRHDHHIGAGRIARLVCDRDDALDALEGETRPAWFATDSLRGTRDLSAYLDDAGTLTVNSETTATGEVQAYFADPTGTAPKYARVIASPSVQTGLSDDSHHVSHVVGSFCAAAGTPQDAVQSLLRARGAGQLTVYANPARRVYKTQADFLREIDAADRAERDLRGTSATGDDPAYLRLKTKVLEHESGVRANYKRTLARELALLGYDLSIDVARDLSAAELARRRARRDALHEAGMRRYVVDRVGAERIDANKAAELRKRNRLTQAEKFALEQFEVRAFYRLPTGGTDAALAELLELDDYGKLRERVRRFEHFLEPDDVARALAEQPTEDTPPLQGDRKHPMLRREFYRRLGEVVGVTPKTDDAALDTWETKSAGLRAEIGTLEAERQDATTRRKGELDRRLAYLRRTLDDHDAALLRTTYAKDDPTVQKLTEWVTANQDALTHLKLIPNGAQIDSGYIVARIGGWLRGAGLTQRRAKGRGARYAVMLSSISEMRGYSRPRRENRQPLHFLPTRFIGMKKGLPPSESACRTVITTPPPNPNPVLVVTDLLEAGKLDAFGPEKLHVIRRKVADQDAGWLHRLANSRDTGRMLGAVR